MDNRSTNIPIHNFSTDDQSSIPFKYLPLEDKEDYDVSIPHRHNYYEIFIFIKGPGTHTIDFKQYPIEAGSIHFLSPGQVHRVQREKGSHGHVIFFSRDFILSDSNNKLWLFELPFLNNNSNPPVIQLSDEQMSEIEPLLQLIQNETNYHKTFSEDILRANLHILLRLFYRFYLAQYPEDIATNSKSLFHQFRALLEKEFTQLHQVQDYAHLLHISTKQLNQVCKSNVAITASQYIFERIILEAKRLLRHSGLSIKEIAVFLNYDDPAHFSKFFKQYTGQYPTDYRES